MSQIRRPAVSGTFYPSKKQQLEKTVKGLLNQALDLDYVKPKALIAPHAGYIYSGSVAASVYKPLIKFKDKINKVILLGPSHHVAFHGLALPESAYFETPLGKIEIDQESVELAKNFEQVSFNDKAHEYEHSLEVHLPFLQETLGNNFKLLPLVVGEASPAEVAQVIQTFWQQEGTLTVISTDLSHYHDYMTAYLLDIQTCSNIENLEFEKLHSEKLCGAAPVRGLLYLAKRNNLKVKMVDFCNSGDSQYNNYISSIANSNESKAIIPKLAQHNIVTIKEYLDNQDDDRVVGYSSYYVGTEQDLGYILSKPQKLELLRVAYKAIEYGLDTGNILEDNRTIFRFDTNVKTATFVTLEIDGKLRGCIGTLQAHRSIVDDVIHNAFMAAFEDPRFSPINVVEMQKMDIRISVLSKPQKIDFKNQKDLLNQIRPGIDGLVLSEAGGYKSTFLPSVWEDLKTPEEFLAHLKVKAGLPENYWSDSLEVERYIVEYITMDKLYS